MQSVRNLAIALALVSAAACSVGPDYVRPEAPAPIDWDAQRTGGLIGGPSDAEVLATWWATLGDPVLSALIERAIAENYDARAAAARVREARGRRRTARAGLLPSVDAAASVTRSTQSEETFGSGSGGNNDRTLYQTGFDASWEVDLFGGRRRELEAAGADLQASREDLRDVLVSLVAEVGLAYVDLRSSQARVEIAGANLVSQTDTFDIARWRAEGGLTTSLDVEQARASLEQTRAAIPSLRTAVAQAKNRLAVLVGTGPGELDYLDRPAPIPTAAVEIAVGVPADTLLRRPDVRRAERQLAAETARVGAAKAAAYPRVNLIGSIGLEAFTAANLFSSGAAAASIAGNVAQTIVDFGRIRGAVEAQDAVREQTLAQFSATVLAAVEEVENAMVAFVEEQARRAALADAAGSAERAAALSRYQYNSGLVDFDTVLVNERSLISLQDQLAASQGEVTANLIRLYKALGGGWRNEEKEA